MRGHGRYGACHPDPRDGERLHPAAGLRRAERREEPLGDVCGVQAARALTTATVTTSTDEGRSPAQ
ncbi:hypothetical protein G419_01210 [Rhodococcus triatomae BKS 15-14]|nr:hypothetical protein G419_01210 [Rhodococcus triatomae BKS 15-14]